MQYIFVDFSLTPEDETFSKEIDKINTIPCPKMWYMKYVSNFKRKRGRCETSVVIKEGRLIIKLRVPRLEDDIMVQDKQHRQKKTRMHSSRMRTVRCSGRLGGGVCLGV